MLDGTDIPVASLFDALIAGQSLADFLAAHPELPPGAAIRVLLRARRLLTMEAAQ